MADAAPPPPPRRGPTLRLKRDLPPRPDAQAPVLGRDPSATRLTGAEEGRDGDEAVNSIDNILSRTRDTRDRWSSRHDAALKAREEAVREQEREIEAKLKTLLGRENAIIERDRVIRETEMLIQARESVIDEREARLRANAAIQVKPGLDLELAEQEKRLEKWEADLEKRAGEMERYEKELAARDAAQMVAALAPEPAEAPAPPPAAHAALDDEALAARVRDLDEREAMLREREAFIEESENTLFEKAQALQELEIEFAHLRDMAGGTAETPETY